MSTIIAFVRPKLRLGFTLFLDLSGFQASHGGFIIVTPLRPDLFLIDEARREIVIFELTCPWDTNIEYSLFFGFEIDVCISFVAHLIERSHNYKEEKYAPLAADLSARFRVSQYSVEVSARGMITKQNGSRLKAFLFKCCDVPNRASRQLIDNCSKASLLSSFSIFSSRNEPSWNSPLPLSIRMCFFFFLSFLCYLL